jgi:hypothetical protein
MSDKQKPTSADHYVHYTHSADPRAECRQRVSRSTRPRRTAGNRAIRTAASSQERGNGDERQGSEDRSAEAHRSERGPAWARSALTQLPPSTKCRCAWMILRPAPATRLRRVSMTCRAAWTTSRAVWTTSRAVWTTLRAESTIWSRRWAVSATRCPCTAVLSETSISALVSRRKVSPFAG